MPASSAPITDDRPTAVVARLAAITTSRLADRNSSGLLVRAACANRRGSRKRPITSIAAIVAVPRSKVLTSPPEPSAWACGAIAPSRKMIGTIARSSNSSIASAERPTGLVVPTKGSTKAVEDRASARPRPERAAPALPDQVQRDADDQRRQRQLRGADPEHQPPHRPQAPERQLQPDREQQEDDAELGERLDRVRVGDGDIVQPRHLGGDRAEPGGANQQPDQDETDHRRDPEPGEGRDHDSRRAEDH